MASAEQMAYQQKVGCTLDTFCYWHSPESFDFVAAAGGSGGDDRWDSNRYAYSYPQWRERDHGFRPANVVVLGHSFMRRLDSFLTRQHGQHFNLGIDYDRAFIQYVYVGGLTADRARADYVHYVLSLAPDVVYIELGTNDLCHPRVGPCEVAERLRSLAMDLVHGGVHLVMVGETIPRASRAIPRVTRGFNDKVMGMNQRLRQLLDPSTTDSTRFWRHRGLQQPNVLCPDGVHLNGLGNQRLYRSVRGAILHALSRVRRHLKYYY